MLNRTLQGPRNMSGARGGCGGSPFDDFSDKHGIASEVPDPCCIFIWVAVKELKLSYYIGETLLFIIYTIMVT